LIHNRIPFFHCKFDIQNNILNFTIHQGSKLIKGKVDNDVFFAQAEVIKVNNYDENLLDELGLKVMDEYQMISSDD